MTASGIDLINKYGRAELGIDGNAAFALLGPDLQEGEAEFVTIPDYLLEGDDPMAAKLIYAKVALKKLLERLGTPQLSYFFGPSHPYGG